MSDVQRIVHRGEYRDDFYWERVDRNLGWLGDTPEEQRDRQKKLRDVTVGIAGTGGIGGSTAHRLIRMGVRNLKLADSDTFDTTNIQRQVGAEIAHLGRNKAEVVGEMGFAISQDVNIEVFPQGITDDTAEEFVNGCDIILDQIDVYAVDAHYALHEAFRRHPETHTILTVLTIGFAAYCYRYTHNSMQIEQVYDLPKGAPHDKDELRQLVHRIVPEYPGFPDETTFHDWWINQEKVSIFGGTPPLCEGVLVELTAMEAMDIPGRYQVPAQPGYAIMDARTWTTRTHTGKWW